MKPTGLFSTRVQKPTILLIAAIGILTATLSSPTSAHEGRQVGDYNFVVGFLREPAYEGQLNAVSLVVTGPTHEVPASGDTSATNEHMDNNSSDDHHHDHDDHDHSHGTEENQSSSNSAGGELDVLIHGAIFISPGLRRDEAFEFEISEELKGLGIPYHIHPGDHQGLIVVSEEHSHDAVEKTVSLAKDGIDPKSIDVNVGDTVVWVNQEFQNTVLMSGPLSSMTPEMKSMAEAASPGTSSQTATPANRVTGLGATLEVELTHLSTSTSKSMPLTELFDDPGHYVAEFIPTAPGDYRVRFFGSIEGTMIDETFDSGPDTFDTVIASDAIQFPVVLESNREIQNAAQGALDAVENLESDLETTSSTASLGVIIGIAGVAFGGIALALSIVAITISRRRN